MKDILYCLAMAFCALFILKLMWRQLADVWELAEMEQSATFDDWPMQGYWGNE